MTKLSVGMIGGSCAAVTDDRYAATLVKLIRGAKRRCLCSIFIIDFSGEHPSFTDILEALEEAVWLGADVRIVIGGSRENYSIAERSASALAVFSDRGIPCRWLAAAPDRRGSHTKLVVVDDTVLLGSHNWSSGAFTDQTQDSILIESAALAAYLSGLMNEQWLRAKE